MKLIRAWQVIVPAKGVATGVVAPGARIVELVVQLIIELLTTGAELLQPACEITEEVVCQKPIVAAPVGAFNQLTPEES